MMRVPRQIQTSFLSPIQDGKELRRSAFEITRVVVTYVRFAVDSSKQGLPACCCQRRFQVVLFVKIHQSYSPNYPIIQFHLPSCMHLKGILFSVSISNIFLDVFRESSELAFASSCKPLQVLIMEFHTLRSAMAVLASPFVTIPKMLSWSAEILPRRNSDGRLEMISGTSSSGVQCEKLTG